MAHDDVMAGVGGATHADVFKAQRERLHTVEGLQRLLATTEPLTPVTFGAGTGTQFRVNPEFSSEIDLLPDTHLVDAYVIHEGQDHQMTKGALLEATSLIGLSKGYVMRTPSHLIEPHLNYWFNDGFDENKKFKFLLTGEDQLASGMCRGSIIPFSNLELLNRTLEGIHTHYGTDTEILVDYKVTHSLAETYMRLVIPEANRVMENTGTTGDEWCAGIQIRNSTIGQLQTEISGYLFRWWCTNGAIDTYGTSGTWNRRGGQGDEVYSWAKNAVDEVLGGMEHSFDAVQELTEHSVDEDELSDTLRTVFETFRVPGPLRRQIIDSASQDGNITMYTIMQAISQAANDLSISAGHADTLMRSAGEFSRAAHHRCPSCHHLAIH